MKKIIIPILAFILVFFLILILFIFLNSNKRELSFSKQEYIPSEKNVENSVNENENPLKNIENFKKEVDICSDEINCSVELPKKIVSEEIEKSKEKFESLVENNQIPENLAPDFTLLDLNGNSVKLSDFRGKPVIVEFWNSWCHNCVRNMPRLQKFYLKNNQDKKFEIIGVNLLGNQDKLENVKNFVNKNKITFPIVLDENLDVASNYNVSVTNTQVLVNKDGTIFEILETDMTEEKLKEFLEFNK